MSQIPDIKSLPFQNRATRLTKHFPSGKGIMRRAGHLAYFAIDSDETDKQAPLPGEEYTPKKRAYDSANDVFILKFSMALG